ncbi:hypothetical protein RRG08_010453 [Elysia crispata]|uniref:Uncharacterized protein n=1 Tax=Elysia crispata TaxID=231223 RepID=A0AAE1ANI4_9GAST|nr:hypothetical protein RRG08_010453 [Elysia crispata]
MADLNFDRPSDDGAHGVITDETPLIDFTRDDNITAGGGAETSFITPPEDVWEAQNETPSWAASSVPSGVSQENLADAQQTEALVDRWRRSWADNYKGRGRCSDRGKYLRCARTARRPPNDQREFLGVCRALETIRGEHTNNLAKLTELDKHIALEERKLEEAPDETTKNIIAERLRKLQDERASRLEAASATREALRSQISRIRETLHRILHEDKTLAERIKNHDRIDPYGTRDDYFYNSPRSHGRFWRRRRPAAAAAAPRQGRGQRVA